MGDRSFQLAGVRVGRYNIVTQINADIPICNRTLNKGLCSDVKETTVIICMNVTLWGRREGGGEWG